MIYAIKTVVGREDAVLNNVAKKAEANMLNISCLAHPGEMKGYIFIEGELDDVKKATTAVPHVRGIIKKPIELKEIEKFFKPRLVEIELNPGDIVEIIGGPFKGERGKVVRYEKVKREVTIELLEVTVPIPIAVSVELVKLVEKKV